MQTATAVCPHRTPVGYSLVYGFNSFMNDYPANDVMTASPGDIPKLAAACNAKPNDCSGFNTGGATLTVFSSCW